MLVMTSLTDISHEMPADGRMKGQMARGSHGQIEEENDQLKFHKALRGPGQAETVHNIIKTSAP